ncbi:8-oxo-dGTP diphosphatase [Halalkalibacter nanhaiisediminis]|uniref:8-oxo-dGTP diphosphatase n=1 Tax=Halalkalibacter nanhaiisediminis TaxID=688079 RepID=A0A562QN82_9BACI|nr:hypothetical protein [Halalkalibacter nanhaiisediminis]TWI58187.1 8-oxo-dGTP diphosphatase [Halalkalibacter nanhaiisediminis]
MKKAIKVVAAIIENEQNEILCALRSPHMSMPTMCEFLGGKVEQDAVFTSNHLSLKKQPLQLLN